MTDWHDLLDRFENRLDRIRAVVDGDAEPPEGHWPPAEVSHDRPVAPIPNELEGRARALLVRAMELEKDLLARREALPEPRPWPRRRRPVPTASVSTEL